MVAILVRRSRRGPTLFNRQQSAVAGLREPQKRKTKRGELYDFALSTIAQEVFELEVLQQR